MGIPKREQFAPVASDGAGAAAVAQGVWDVKDKLGRAGVYEDTCFDEITTVLGQEGWLLGSSGLLDQLLDYFAALDFDFWKLTDGSGDWSSDLTMCQS